MKMVGSNSTIINSITHVVKENQGQNDTLSFSEYTLYEGQVFVILQPVVLYPVLSHNLGILRKLYQYCL